jgi:heme/copper-type cytochrome/quinol oxidase subunit 4
VVKYVRFAIMFGLAIVVGVGAALLAWASDLSTLHAYLIVFGLAALFVLVASVVFLGLPRGRKEQEERSRCMLHLSTYGSRPF